MDKIKSFIASIPNKPIEGVTFRDISPLLGNADSFNYTIEKMKSVASKLDFDIIAAVDARGFIFGSALAFAMYKPMCLIRKQGKLMCDTISESYDLEYGSATIEIAKDAFKNNSKVLLIDDVLATGGTTKACLDLIKKASGTPVATLVLIELLGLKGREKLDCDVLSLAQYD